MDKLFRVSVLSKTEMPQQLIYAAMKQDYSSRYVGEIELLPENRCGEIVCEKLLAGNRGHYGPLEHPSISFAIGYFPHSTMQQVSRHRVGVSIDCQSFRYTGAAIAELGRLVSQTYSPEPISEFSEMGEKLFYLRPPGIYTGKGKDGQITSYVYSEQARNDDLRQCLHRAMLYRNAVEIEGYSYEQARGMLPFDIRQHWVMSFNLRSLMHILDLRWKKDAQLECQQLCDLLFEHAKMWCPEIMAWYEKNRMHKGVLAP